MGLRYDYPRQVIPYVLFLNIFLLLRVEEVRNGAFGVAVLKATNLRPSAGCHATSKATHGGVGDSP